MLKDDVQVLTRNDEIRYIPFADRVSVLAYILQNKFNDQLKQLDLSIQVTSNFGDNTLAGPIQAFTDKLEQLPAAVIGVTITHKGTTTTGRVAEMARDMFRVAATWGGSNLGMEGYDPLDNPSSAISSSNRADKEYTMRLALGLNESIVLPHIQ